MHRVVVFHPFDGDGGSLHAYRVLSLSDEGVITPGEVFEMGQAQATEIVFTPDGRTGIVPQQDGTLGVFRLDDRGKPTVVHAGYRGSFWASKVVIEPDGERALVLDSQWVEHGGGLYAVRIGPTGALTEEGKLVEAKLPYGFAALASRRALVAGYRMLDSHDGPSLHLVELDGGVRRVASCAPFGKTEAIMASMVLTSDRRYVLVGDNNEFSDVPNRVVVVRVTDSGPTPVQGFTPMRDPVQMVASPFGGPVLVVSGFGNAIYVLDYDAGDGVAPFACRGELDYVGEAPELPAAAVCVPRGPCAGRVLVGETGGIRQLQFVAPPEGVEDCGLHALDATVSAIGVTYVR